MKDYLKINFADFQEFPEFRGQKETRAQRDSASQGCPEPKATAASREHQQYQERQEWKATPECQDSQEQKGIR